MWQEVYLSALLRAILYADDANYVSPSSRQTELFADVFL